MKSKKLGAKNCSIGANCKNTCISNDKNCLITKNSSEIAAIVKKIKKKELTRSEILNGIRAKNDIPLQPTGLAPKVKKKPVVSDESIDVDFFPPKKIMATTEVPKLKTLSGANELPPKVKYIAATGKELGRGVSGIATLNSDGNVVKTITGSKINLQKDIVNQNLAASLGISPKVLSYSDNQITMERAAGETVFNQRKMADKHLEQNVRNTAEIALTMHKAGMAHNDAHAGNIVYDKKTGKTQLLDFGLSKNKSSIGERFDEYTERFSEHINASYGLNFDNPKDYGKFLNSI